jgi:2-keto-4-pentenoate hydratase
MSADFAAAAAELDHARRSARAIDRFSDGLAPTSIDEAYGIQRAWEVMAEWPVVGWKVGCTSQEAQQMLATDGPFVGRVFGPFLHHSPTSLPVTDLITPRMEGEFAFVMGATLVARSQPYLRDEVEAAVAALHPAIEIVDTRFADFTGVGVLSLIADCGANGGLVLGDAVDDWRDIDLAATEVVMRIDGEVVGRGTGADVLGHPMESLTWLVNELSRQGTDLRSGAVVTTGTCTSAVVLAPGSTATTDHGPLGSVSFGTR